MGMPTWWGQRRYGLFVHASIATVPAWAPIGQEAGWYWSHLGADLPDTMAMPQPLVEVLAHQRERWDFIDHFDDFLPLLTFDRFDAEAWARLAVDAGMGYTVMVAKDHDGLCWWDAPGVDRTTVAHGPRRNVLAEYAAACERNDLVFGAAYSLLDWADPRYPTPEYVEEVVHAHATDLVERFGANMLSGEGHWGHGPSTWRAGELLPRLRKLQPDLIVNDRWWASADDAPGDDPPILKTFEHDPPADIVDEPWELRRAIGGSSCHNRVERAEHHLGGFDVVALLTEVAAKGGNLLLAVGPAADGTIPDLQAAPLLEAGAWVRRHHDLLENARPWSTWGDDDVRYLVVGGELHALDIGGAGRFAAIDPADHRVTAVSSVDGAEVAFRHDADGLQLLLPRGLATAGSSPIDVPVYRLTVEAVERPAELFAPQPRAPAPLAPLLADAQPGDIVQLGDGRYLGPADVPGGVVLRGLGAARTIVDGAGGPALRLGRGARVEHLTVTGAGASVVWSPAPAIEIDGYGAGILGCTVDGHVVVGADDVVVRASSLTGIAAQGAHHLAVSRCDLVGNRWDVGIELQGGADHEIESSEFTGHLCAIRATDTTGVVVRGNNLRARWWAVHLERTERSHVHGNQIRETMRAVDLDGGSEALIDGNAVFDGDSGCVVQGGASGCQVSGNRWERCRIGLLAWDSTGLHDQDNRAIDLHEPEHAVQAGP